MTISEKQAELQRLKSFFAGIELPVKINKLEGYMTLHNVRTFVDSNFRRAEKGIENPWNDAAIIRLQSLERHLRSTAQSGHQDRSQ